MKPDFDKLSKEYSESARVVIADVDCTVHQDLCGEHGVQGYPTIKYYMGGEPEDYDGGRSYADLKKFVDDNLMEPSCDSNNKEACTEEQIKSLSAAEALSADERKEKIAAFEKDIKDANKAHEKLVEGLQKQYEESMESTEKKVKEIKKEMKWLKAVKAAPKKDEL